MKMKKRVLAVLALALLIINMLPVRVAEAAETSKGVYYPDLLRDVNFGSYETQVRNICNTYPCIAVCVLNTNPNYFKYYFFAESASKELRYYASWGNCGIHTATYCVTVRDGSVIYIEHNAENRIQATFNHIGGKCDTELLGTNFDVVYSSECSKNSGYDSVYNQISAKTNNLVHPNDYVPDPVYTSSSPYLKDITYSYSNQFYLDGNDDFDESYFHYTSNIGNNSSGYTERSVKISGYVCMPSQSFVNEMLSKYGAGLSNMREFMHIASGAYFPDWLASVDLGDGTSFKKWYFTMDVPCGNVFDLSITNQELFDLVEKYNRVDLVEYYGCSGNPFMEDFLKCYMWIHRFDGVITDTYSDAIVYGNCTSFIFLTFSNEVIMSVGYSDPNSFGPPVDFVGPMLPDSTVQPSINNAYKDAIKDAQVEYEYNLNLDADSEDVFKLFGSLSEGIKNMSGSFRDLSIAVGNVFSFFPQEITYIIYAGFIAMIVIAVYKALRG